MPRITFVQDVPNEDGSGTLYAAGYQADVSDNTARRWTQTGQAVIGSVSVEPKRTGSRRLETRTAAITEAPVQKGGKPRA